MTITVYGTPGPQGSKRHLGRGIMIEMSKKVKPWREAVKWAAISQASFPPLDNALPILGPVSLRIVFTLKRPKSAKPGARPDKRPDLSKLIRSTEDALTEAGVWEDDARVVQCLATKVYVGDQIGGALDRPGAVIEVIGAENTQLKLGTWA